MSLGACLLFWMDSGGFQRFAGLVVTVKFVALNLKQVDNCGKFLWEVVSNNNDPFKNGHIFG